MSGSSRISAGWTNDSAEGSPSLTPHPSPSKSPALLQPTKSIFKQMKLLPLVIFAFGGLMSSAIASQPPNILLILADDLGYGDVSAR